MSSINFDRLAKTVVDKNERYIYSDVHLDLKQEVLNVSGVGNAPPDIKMSYDVEAVKNSLRNLFNTLPGQMHNDQTFGLNFLQFVFQPITELNAGILGDRILDGIDKLPRVEVKQIQVTPKFDQQEYHITLNLIIPSLTLNNSDSAIFSAKLNKQGFTI